MRVLRKNNTGYSFSEAKKVAERRTTYPNKSKLKVVYGTATKKFHFIMPDDRDYKTSFSISIYDFMRIKSGIEAKKILSGVLIVR